MTRQKKLRTFAFIVYVVAQLLPTNLQVFPAAGPNDKASCRLGDEEGWPGWGFVMTGFSPLGASMALDEFRDHGNFAGTAGDFFVREPSRGFACLPGFAANLLFLIGLWLSCTRWRSSTRSISVCAAACAVISATAWYWTGIIALSCIPILGPAAWIAAMFLLAAAAKGMTNDDPAPRQQELQARVDAAELARVQEFADKRNAGDLS